MALSGLFGSSYINGVEITADKWTNNFMSAKVDRSNFSTLGEPLLAPGQRGTEFTVEGPFEFPLPCVEGIFYQFTLGVTADYFIIMTGLVTELEISQNHKDGPRFKISASRSGVVTSRSVN